MSTWYAGSRQWRGRWRRSGREFGRERRGRLLLVHRRQVRVQRLRSHLLVMGAFLERAVARTGIQEIFRVSGRERRAWRS
jgi:hypothetical protein